MAQRITDERDLRNIKVEFLRTQIDSRPWPGLDGIEEIETAGGVTAVHVYEIVVSGYSRELSYEEVVKASGLREQSAPFLISEIRQNVGRDEYGDVFVENLPHNEG